MKNYFIVDYIILLIISIFVLCVIMGDYDPVLALRAHWCEILEQELECPVCLCVATDRIHICDNGHNVCHLCMKELKICPVCKASFSQIRSRTLEELSKKFQEMKSSLMDLSHEYDGRRKQKLIQSTTASQTEALDSVKSVEQKNCSTQTSSTHVFSAGCKTPRRSMRLKKSRELI
ncbi:hypothetical protein PV327_006204 [Microctonus hyperodae]|uniref:RING-type domain-containing protein n=1 Tax=Microctonus hyperodae TaxID=165561 RepID=A0AA39F3U2_MICHY|nr:hypothetical protein PV327_006204 [Microctonus hyperodae]